MESKPAIRLKTRLHQTEYTSEEVLKLSRFGLGTESWVWAALCHTAQLSEVKRLQKSEILAALATLERLYANVRWRRLSNVPMAEVTSDLVMEMFVLLEDDLIAQPTLGNHSRHTTSLRTRKLLLNFIDAKGAATAAFVRKRFRTRLRKSHDDHRQLISDDAVELDGKMLPPVGAIPHQTLRELQTETERILNRPLDKIRDACSAVFQEYQSAIGKLDDLSREPLDKSLFRYLKGFVRRGTALSKSKRLVVRKPIRDVVKAYLAIAAQQRNFNRFTMFRGGEIEAFIKQEICQDWRQESVFGPEIYASHVMLACLLVLQCHTKWNCNSVLELQDDWISSDEAPFEMRSYKRRTNSSTPISSVEASDHDVVWAVTFLRRRLDSLKRLGLVNWNEQRLWLNAAQRDANGVVRPYVGWGTFLKRFISRHNLPRFSLEQVRVQSLTALSVRKGGLAVAKEAAGQASIRTTGIYIDQLIAKRLNSAINLEFQRRLENEVNATATNSKAQRSGLLRPIGDGAYCSDPIHPPFEDYLQEGLCNGHSCHSSGGCVNRRLVVNDQSMEAALRTSIYYQRNWSRLMDENRDKFLKYHLPAMLFNFAYVEVLQKGRYGSKLRAIQRRIADAQALSS